MLPPITSSNQYALLDADDNTSLPNPTTTGVPTGGLGDLIGAETINNKEDIGASSFDLL
jgi:hypothetical protein